MTRILVGIAITVILPLLVIKILSFIDNEYKDRLAININDFVLLTVFPIVYVIMINKLFIYDYYEYLINCILIGYLIIMAYTDVKTQMVYSIVSIIVSIALLTILIVNINKCNFSIITAIIIGLLVIFSFTGMLGLGDVVIYINIALYYLICSNIPYLNFMINIFIANFIFLILNIFKNKKCNLKINDKKPFTLFILISTTVCNFISI